MPRMRNNRNRRRPKRNQNRYWSPTGKELTKGYRPGIARTLQLATFRKKSQVLKFEKQITFELDPQINEMYFLTLRANCMNEILLPYTGNNAAGTWNPTDAAFNSGVNIRPQGFDGVWDARYEKHTVLGSRISVVCKGLDGGLSLDPTNVYIVSSQSPTYIQNSTTRHQIEQRPFVVKNYQNSNTGMVGQSRLFSQMSVKRFLGVTDLKDVEEASALNVGTSTPSKSLYYHLCLCNALQNQFSNDISRQHITIKMEYITQLHGITGSNVPQAGNADVGINTDNTGTQHFEF